MEHLRTTNPYTGDVYQWVDVERYIALDTVTGETVLIPGCGHVVTREQALGFLQQRQGWESRTVLVRLDAIAGFLIARRKE